MNRQEEYNNNRPDYMTIQEPNDRDQYYQLRAETFADVGVDTDEDPAYQNQFQNGIANHSQSFEQHEIQYNAHNLSYGQQENRQKAQTGRQTRKDRNNKRQPGSNPKMNTTYCSQGRLKNAFSSGINDSYKARGYRHSAGPMAEEQMRSSTFNSTNQRIASTKNQRTGTCNTLNPNSYHTMHTSGNTSFNQKVGDDQEIYVLDDHKLFTADRDEERPQFGKESRNGTDQIQYEHNTFQRNNEEQTDRNNDYDADCYKS